MKKTIATILLTMIYSFAYAESFDIGDKTIVVLPPIGYSLVTEEMDAVYRLSLQMADPDNDLLACYIPFFDVEDAIDGEMPFLERYFLLKVNKQLKNMIVGSKDFDELKQITKQQNKEIFTR